MKYFQNFSFLFQYSIYYFLSEVYKQTDHLKIDGIILSYFKK